MFSRSWPSAQLTPSLPHSGGPAHRRAAHLDTAGAGRGVLADGRDPVQPDHRGHLPRRGCGIGAGDRAALRRRAGAPRGRPRPDGVVLDSDVRVGHALAAAAPRDLGGSALRDGARFGGPDHVGAVAVSGPLGGRDRGRARVVRGAAHAAPVVLAERPLPDVVLARAAGGTAGGAGAPGRRAERSRRSSRCSWWARSSERTWPRTRC